MWPYDYGTEELNPKYPAVPGLDNFVYFYLPLYLDPKVPEQAVTPNLHSPILHHPKACNRKEYQAFRHSIFRKERESLPNSPNPLPNSPHE